MIPANVEGAIHDIVSLYYWVPPCYDWGHARAMCGAGWAASPIITSNIPSSPHQFLSSNKGWTARQSGCRVYKWLDERK